jgi:KDO2-lipid IV(A) lauroyltransferase
MKKIGYYLFEIFSRFLAALPKHGIYIFADFLFFLAYYIIGYRKKVVFENLSNSFPEKSKNEIKSIAKKFYRHLGDIIIENAAILNMSQEKVQQFTVVRNIEQMNQFHEKNKNVIAITAHYGNWELLPTLSPHTKYKILSVYKPLKNKFFDKKIYQMRKRFNGVPVPMKSVYKEITKQQREGNSFILGLVADQCPPRKYINYWTTFLNQETPFFTGSEKIARKFNHAVVLTLVKKRKRGLYEIDFIPLVENAKEMNEAEITEQYVRELEKTINENPPCWLWSHRRWKYKKADLA